VTDRPGVASLVQRRAYPLPSPMSWRRPGVSYGGRGFWSGAIATGSLPNSRRPCSKHSPVPP